MSFKFAAVALALCLPVAATATESLVNGSFEAGSTGFAATGPVGVFSGQDYVLGAGGSGSAAAQANHFAAFGGGNVAGVSTISQSFATVAGRSYTVGFDYGAFNFNAEQLVYSLTGTAGAVLSTPAGTSNLDAIFTRYSTTFVGTGALTTISFAVNAFGGDNADILVDNASVTSVPDAPTWALLIAGFGMVGVAARRRAVATA